MGNCIGIKIRNCMRFTWNKVTCRKKPKTSIVLMMVGLDNAGKSAVVNYLYNKSLLTKESVVPTIGFRTVIFNYKSCSIRIYDVGGGPQIRALWPKYYGDVHGVIYVVDANDIERLSENADVFQELVCHELITQKPILFLGNKQDLKNAIDEVDLIQFLNIEGLVNFAKCYTRVEICSCYPDDNRYFNLNKNIDKGFSWLIEEIQSNYEYLDEEVKTRKPKRKVRRSFRMNSWAAENVDNDFDYSDTDSEVYLKPIVPDDYNTPKKRKKKRKILRRLFCIRNNRTAPSAENLHESVLPTTESMKELIRSIKIEDLIRNTEINENFISEYRRPKRRPKKRPNTAPAQVKPFEVKPIQKADTIIDHVQS